MPVKTPSKVLTGVKSDNTSSPTCEAKPTPVPLGEHFIPNPALSAANVTSASGSPDLAVVETEVTQDIVPANRNQERHGFVTLRRFVDIALQRYEPTTSSSSSSSVSSCEYLITAAMLHHRYLSGPTVPTHPNPGRFSKSIRPRRYFASEVSLSDFTIRAELGSGAFGIVYRVEDKITNQTMALKVIKKRELADDYIPRFRAELDAMKRLLGDHHCMQVEASFQDEECLYLALAFYSGGDLHDLISNYPRGILPIEHARIYAAELLVGVHHLHRQGIIHRDLKPSNILVDSQGHLVIADLGMAKIFPLEDPDTFSPYNPTGKFACLSQTPYLAGTFCGTMEYMAPEIILGYGYGFAVDFWAVGVILYELLVGRPPWIMEDGLYVPKAITLFPPYFVYDFHPYAKNLLENMLHKNVSQRLLYKQMLRHPFFSSIDWEEVENRTFPPVRTPVIEEYDPSSTHPISLGQSGPASDPLPNFNFISPTLKRERRRFKSSWKTKAEKNMKGLPRVVSKIFSNRNTPEKEKHAPTLVHNDETCAVDRASGAVGLSASYMFWRRMRRHPPPCKDGQETLTHDDINQGEQPPSPQMPTINEDAPLIPLISLEATLVGSSSGQKSSPISISSFKRWIKRILHPIPTAHVLLEKNRKPIDLTA